VNTKRVLIARKPVIANAQRWRHEGDSFGRSAIIPKAIAKQK
jgi:hypothetical protein